MTGFPTRALLLTALACLCLAAGSGCVYIAPLGFGPQKLREDTVVESPRLFELNKIAVCEVEGVIGVGSGLWPVASPGDLKEKLDLAAADSRVRAVVIRINSPGGEVTASDVMYRELCTFREETGKPVVACILGTGTSGACYIALGADHIVCHPTAVTGSVGVIAQYMNVEELLRKLGLRPEPIASGDKKDIGSPTRQMTDEERKLLQGIVDHLFNRFYGIVKERRPRMTEEALGVIRDGRVLTAAEALDLGLADSIGYMDDAISTAMRMAGIDSADVVMYRRGGGRGRSVYASSGPADVPVAELVKHGLRALVRPPGAAFMYIWDPAR